MFALLDLFASFVLVNKDGGSHGYFKRDRIDLLPMSVSDRLVAWLGQGHCFCLFLTNAKNIGWPAERAWPFCCSLPRWSVTGDCHSFCLFLTNAKILVCQQQQSGADLAILLFPLPGDQSPATAIHFANSFPPIPTNRKCFVLSSFCYSPCFYCCCWSARGVLFAFRELA